MSTQSQAVVETEILASLSTIAARIGRDKATLSRRVADGTVIPDFVIELGNGQPILAFRPERQGEIAELLGIRAGSAASALEG